MKTPVLETRRQVMAAVSTAFPGGMDCAAARLGIKDMPIDTGRDSQAPITGAAVSAMLDPGYSVRWKTAAGFVVLDAQQIIGVATAARAHVQAAFNREAELLEALEAGTFTPEMLEQGWPA